MLGRRSAARWIAKRLASCSTATFETAERLPLRWEGTPIQVLWKEDLNLHANEFCPGGPVVSLICWWIAAERPEEASDGRRGQIFRSSAAAHDWDGELHGYRNGAGAAGDDDDVNDIRPGDEADEQYEAGDGAVVCAGCAGAEVFRVFRSLGIFGRERGGCVVDRGDRWWFGDDSGTGSVPYHAQAGGGFCGL